MKKVDYSKLFTKRKDGCYQKYVNGKYIYSKDPEKLFHKWQELITGPTDRKFIEVAQEWEREHREKITIRTWLNYKPHYENILNTHIDKYITEITTQDVIIDLSKAKAQGSSATIVKTIKAIYSSIFEYAISKSYISYNPALSAKVPKGLKKTKRTAPTDEEIKVVLNSIDKPFGFFPFFLLCTGMRKGEALAIDLPDIDFKKDEISITKSLVYNDNANPSVKSPKTEGSVRKVPILSILKPELQKWIGGLTGEHLFPAQKSNRNPGGGYMTERGYDVAWSNYCQATGLNITAHQLRHGAATIMFESGVDVYTAQRILGHSNITTTMSIYTELREKQQRKSIAKFDKKMSKYLERK